MSSKGPYNLVWFNLTLSLCLPCNPFLSRLMRSGYFARSCSERSIFMAPLIPRTPPTNIPLTLTLEAEELSPVKELLLFDLPIAAIGLLLWPLSLKSKRDCVLLAAIFRAYRSNKGLRRQCDHLQMEWKRQGKFQFLTYFPLTKFSKNLFFVESIQNRWCWKKMIPLCSVQITNIIRNSPIIFAEW